MSYWGKFIGGLAGFAMGGPVGALFGAALGHAADEGKFQAFSFFGDRVMPFDDARTTAMLGGRDQVFAVSVTVLAAKLAKCDGPVNRAEIAGFKTSFAIPPENAAEVGRLFDSARDSAEGFERYALQLGQAFSDSRGILEQVLAGLYQVARADDAVNGAEAAFLARVGQAFRLDEAAIRRAAGGAAAAQPTEDAYAVLGLRRNASAEEIRARWKQLVREHHPDVLASQGASASRIKLASEKVARINAAYDAIKRERRL
ncbi:TerB family tellurite resistance protein [Acidocella sp. KAb 2-4]|uniref:TerB family tellurite resistance protein n=1 Tax=Acidocella sp. KAb 2-4 TaxID=2885158 RepID=UPI001D05E83D|nr:TerB family tellurite resistance protein [Acidocella sp. KAb 2-4]MCB5945105.1 TerB family tellurite resistance protein [Acidocella sp. KAb 2-4]